MTEEEKRLMIVKFREQFGCGVMEAKKVLTDNNYDYDKAVENTKKLFINCLI